MKHFDYLTNRLFLIVLLLLIPEILFANAGTTLVLAAWFHLIFVNLIIGIYESFLLHKKEENIRKSSLVFIIIANYFSLICGFVLTYYISKKMNLDLMKPENEVVYIFQNIILFIILFFVSIFSELPFFKLSLKNKTWRQSLNFSFKINLRTNIIVVIFYMAFQVFSMIQAIIFEKVYVSSNLNIKVEGPGTQTLITKHTNGQKATEANYINDKLEGKYQSWFENGNLESEIYYKNGKRHGVYTEYYLNGKIKVIRIYNEDIFIKDSIRLDINGNNLIVK